MAVLANSYSSSSANITTSCIVVLVDFLLANAWTVPAYWNGTSFVVNPSPSVNPFTVTTLAVSFAGFILQSPDGRQISVQRGSELQWRMLYSPYAGFRDGWITCVAKASLTDGQTVTLTDSNGNIVWIGEWDTNGIITPGRTALDISTAVTATDCATVLANAVTSNCPHLTVYSASTPTLYFVKNTRIGYLSVAVSGGITAFAPRGTFSSVSYTASGPEQGAFLPTFGSEGTDQSPSFGTLNGKNRINAVTTDTSPYSFFFVAFDNSAASSSAPTVIMMDRVSERPASSWDDAVLSAGNGLPSYAENGSVRAHAWIGPASSRGWGSVQPMETTSDGSNVLVNPAGPTDPWTQQSSPQPVQYVRRPVSTQGGPGQYGWTGKSLLLAWNTSDQAYGDLLNTTATGDRACFSLFSIPWNNTPIVQ